MAADMDDERVSGLDINLDLMPFNKGWARKRFGPMGSTEAKVKIKVLKQAVKHYVFT